MVASVSWNDHRIFPIHFMAFASMREHHQRQQTWPWIFKTLFKAYCSIISYTSFPCLIWYGLRVSFEKQAGMTLGCSLGCAVDLFRLIWSRRENCRVIIELAMATVSPGFELLDKSLWCAGMHLSRCRTHLCQPSPKKGSDFLYGKNAVLKVGA